MARGKSQKTLDLVDAAARILDEIQPATVRAVCYRLFVAGLIAGMEKKNTNRVSRALVFAREHDLIPWDHIVDETRKPEIIGCWSDPESIIRTAMRQYRKDYWEAQPLKVEVWSEKGTVRGTLAPVLDEFEITFRVLHGYSSATTVKTCADESLDTDKPVIALYCGDFDPSGLHMSEVDLPDRLERYGGEIDLRRVALRPSDLDTLPSFPASDKARDPRYRWFVEGYGHRCWELDAMDPRDLRTRVAREITSLIDQVAWDHVQQIEAAEVESMRGLLDAWKSKLRQASK